MDRAVNLDIANVTPLGSSKDFVDFVGVLD